MSKLSRIFTYNTVFVISVFIFFSCSLSKPKINYDPKGQYSLGRYIYSINLDDIVDDKVYVHLHCPGLNQQTVAYHFPKTIPGTYKELDYGEMIETIETVLGKKAIIDRQPEQPGDVPQTWADVSKANKLFGYKPSISFKDGVTEFYKWQKALTSLHSYRIF